MRLYSDISSVHINYIKRQKLIIRIGSCLNLPKIYELLPNMYTSSVHMNCF